jgi:hypothetical protein
LGLTLNHIHRFGVSIFKEQNPWKGTIMGRGFLALREGTNYEESMEFQL